MGCHAETEKCRGFILASPLLQAAEIMRVPLEELVLQIHYLRLAPRAETFLARVLQPPPARAVEGALRMLREVGALTQEERLTPLGASHHCCPCHDSALQRAHVSRLVSLPCMPMAAAHDEFATLPQVCQVISTQPLF